MKVNSYTQYKNILELLYANRGDQTPQREMSIKNALTVDPHRDCACSKHEIAHFYDVVFKKQEWVNTE